MIIKVGDVKDSGSRNEDAAFEKVIYKYTIVDNIDHVEVNHVRAEVGSAEELNKYLSDFGPGAIISIVASYNSKTEEVMRLRLIKLIAYRKSKANEDAETIAIVTDKDMFLCNDEGQTIERLRT